MKSAYELAMERLNKQSPGVTLTAAQKQRIADLESEYKAKIADREILIKGQIAKAVDKGSFEEVEQLEKQLVSNRKSLAAELEEKKAHLRDGGK